MATHSHQPLNPSAAVFIPSPSYHYTVMNQPRYDILCRYHIHESGNHCRYGLGCRYVHAQELYRPSLGEQTATLLLAVHSLILFAVSCFQQTQATAPQAYAAQQTSDVPEEHAAGAIDPETVHPRQHDVAEHGHPDAADVPHSKTSSVVDADETDMKDDSNAGPTGGLHFENHIEAQVDFKDNDDDMDLKVDIGDQHMAALNLSASNIDIADKADDHMDVKHEVDDDHPLSLETLIMFPITNDKLGSGETEELWRFVLANSPEKLVVKYPKLLQVYRKQKHFDGMDAILLGLKTTSLNGKPVIIKGYNGKKERFIVHLHEYLETPKPLLIKNENLQTLNPHPITDALKQFRDDIGNDEWLRLTENNTCYYNDKLRMAFIRFQFPFYDRQTATKDGYEQLFADALKYSIAHALGITTADCPSMISLLYSMCHFRGLHMMRIFVVPPHWTPQQWNTNLHVLQPPND